MKAWSEDDLFLSHVHKDTIMEICEQNLVIKPWMVESKIIR